jgi:hypothetical protein
MPKWYGLQGLIIIIMQQQTYTLELRSDLQNVQPMWCV